RPPDRRPRAVPRGVRPHAGLERRRTPLRPRAPSRIAAGQPCGDWRTGPDVQGDAAETRPVPRLDPAQTTGCRVDGVLYRQRRLAGRTRRKMTGTTRPARVLERLRWLLLPSCLIVVTL